jgi:hypothetical protein
MSKTQGLPNDLPQVELGKEDKQTLSSAESAIHAAQQDIETMGEDIDYSKMTLEQLKKEFAKERKEQTLFRLQMRRVISEEVEKQVQPLAIQLKQLTTQKPKFVYLKIKWPTLDFWKWSAGIIKLFFTGIGKSFLFLIRKIKRK